MGTTKKPTNPIKNLENELQELEENISEVNQKDSSNAPSSSPKAIEVNIIEDLKFLSEVFEKIEQETAEVAEEIFDILVNASDEEIATGTVPLPKSSKKIKEFLMILNRLFVLSRKLAKEGSVLVINRKAVQEFDKKTFAISMCYDGGVSLDVLCDIANEENRARTPSKSLKVTTTIKLSAQSLSLGAER